MNKHISDEKKEQILQRSDIVSIIGNYIDLKKNGLNYFGKCPFHKEKDASFSVSPTKQFFYCFGCGEGGDVIDFLMKFSRFTFTQSLKFLADKAGIGITDGDLVVLDDDYRKNIPPRREKPEFVPATPAAPADLWREKAEKFVAWAAENLSGNAAMISWLSDRGIPAETAARFRLGWNPGEGGKDLYRPRKAWGLEEVLRDNGRPKALWIPRGLVIPLVLDGRVSRIRIRRPEGEPRYYVLPGSSMATMLLEPQRRAFVVVEAELDAIAVAAAQEEAGAVGLGSVAAKPDAASFAILKEALQILNALDYDVAGAKAMAWWAEQFARCARWPVPQGKDPGESVKLGTDLKSWIRAGLPPALTIGAGAGVAAAVTAEKRSDKIQAESMQPKEAPVPPGVPETILELRDLLRKNPQVRIINTPTRYTVHRNGKYVGGRIGELVFRHMEVVEYLTSHPAREIDASNLIVRMGSYGAG